MNVFMTREEYEQLPFRDDWDGDYREDFYYRAKAYPNTAFKWRGGKWGHSEWWAFGVTFKPSIP